MNEEINSTFNLISLALEVIRNQNEQKNALLLLFEDGSLEINRLKVNSKRE